MEPTYKLIRFAVIVNGIAEIILIASLWFSADWFNFLGLTVGLGFVLTVSLLLLPLLFRSARAPRFYYLIAAIVEMLFPIVFFMWAMRGTQC